MSASQDFLRGFLQVCPTPLGRALAASANAGGMLACTVVAYPMAAAAGATGGSLSSFFEVGILDLVFFGLGAPDCGVKHQKHSVRVDLVYLARLLDVVAELLVSLE